MKNDLSEALFTLIKLETILAERGLTPSLVELAKKAREIIEQSIKNDHGTEHQ